MLKQEIREQLLSLSEEDFKAFNEKLLPGVAGVLGVRLPKLRALAKKIAKNDAGAYLGLMRESDWSTGDYYYEEKMLYGLVIGYAKMNDIQYKEQLDAFVPLIDNWAVCDSCCITYKWMKRQPSYWWEYLNQWIRTDTEFGIRFGIVAILCHFVEEAYCRDIFEICNAVHNEGYYAKMAVAWLVSICFTKFPEDTYAFLETDRMDVFTHNKSIQKTCESYRVTKEWKALARGLRRMAE